MSLVSSFWSKAVGYISVLSIYFLNQFLFRSFKVLLWKTISSILLKAYLQVTYFKVINVKLEAIQEIWKNIEKVKDAEKNNPRAKAVNIGA